MEGVREKNVTLTQQLTSFHESTKVALNIGKKSEPRRKSSSSDDRDSSS
jgi:hypothetical protein